MKRTPGFSRRLPQMAYFYVYTKRTVSSIRRWTNWWGIIVKMSANGSKFYARSLTLLLPILKMINEGYTAAQIAEALQTDRSHIHYYIKKAIDFQYVEDITRDTFKARKLTQEGKNFVDQYTKPVNNKPICRLENIRFKAPIYKMPPPESLDWNKIQMNNWAQYGSRVDDIKVQINYGKNPTIEFIPAAVDGDDPYKLRDTVSYDCFKVAEKLEETLGIAIGRLEQSSRPEFVVYDAVAKTFSKRIGQVNVEGIGKVNASGPRYRGEFEFCDPRAAAEYLKMPMRLEKMEQDVKEIRDLLRKKSDSDGWVESK
jgi:hypothetical protein